MSDTRTTPRESSRSLAQVDKFREAARELETDQSEEAFDHVLKKIAKAPPPKDDKSDQKR